MNYCFSCTHFFKSCVLSFLLMVSFFLTSSCTKREFSDDEFKAIVASVLDDVYRKGASECSVNALAQDLLAVLTSLNIINPQVTMILNLLSNFGTQVSQNDILVGTQIDIFLQQISLNDAAILSAIDNASCCSVLENLIVTGDALIGTQIGTLSQHVSINDAEILSSIDACCSSLDTRIGQLSDVGTIFPGGTATSGDINALHLNIIQLLKTILIQVTPPPA